MYNSSAFLSESHNSSVYNITESTGASDAVMYISMFITPIFILGGICGNTISFVVFVHTHLKYNSSSVYLAALNVVDSGFLLALLPAWLGWIHVDIFHMEGWCQTTIYLTYVFAFLSVWIVVSFTLERFVVVFYPLRRAAICTTRRALITVGILVGVALIYYSYTLWTTFISDYRGLPTCMSKTEYHSALRVLSVVDTFITLVVPSILIILLNSGISLKLILYYRKHTPAAHEGSTTKSNSSSSGSPPHADNTLDQKLCDISTHKKSAFSFSTAQVQLQRRRSFQNRTTRTLLLISTIFVVLNLPSHLFRIYAVCLALAGQEDPVTFTKSLIQELCLLLYYANFACNLFLYTLCSNSFRKALIKLKNRMVRRICKTCFWYR